MALKLSNDDFYFLSDSCKLLFSDEGRTISFPTNPAVIQTLSTTAISLFNTFGVSVGFIRRTSTPDPLAPWKEISQTTTFGGLVIKSKLGSSYERSTLPDQLINSSKFLVKSDRIIEIGDEFEFIGTNFTIQQITLINPTGIRFYQEVLAV